MKIFKIFLAIEHTLEAVTELFNTKKTLSQNLVPVRVKNTQPFMMVREREAERRQNQKNNIL